MSFQILITEFALVQLKFRILNVFIKEKIASLSSSWVNVCMYSDAETE